MKAFIFQSDIYCEDCGKAIRAERTVAGYSPIDPEDESSYDSDVFPKGPYGDGGGEADSPQHCGGCGLFLENPLTSDGVVYVEEKAKEFGTASGDMAWSDIAEAAERGGKSCLAEWIIFYLAWGR